jgi:glutathione S-transferase
MSQPVTLGYWNIRGLAERIRLVLEYLQIPYNQVIFTPEQEDEWFSKIKPQFLEKNPAANLPYLQDGEKVISESDAIIVYLCFKANRADLLGENADDQVQIATVMGVFKDLSKAFSGYCYGAKPYEEIKEEAIKSLKPSIDKLQGLLGERSGLQED